MKEEALETISSRDPSGLPPIDRLLDLARALAVLDATLCPEWEFRYFSFNDSWGEDGDQKLLFMRDGEGDHLEVHFHRDGALVKGFAHEAPMAADRPLPGLFEGLPPALDGLLDDETSSRTDTTFCLWRQHDDERWHRGSVEVPPDGDADGSERLLRFLDGDPQTYVRWATEYLGRAIPDEAVEHVFAQRPMSAALARTLDPSCDVAELLQEVEEIGYPVTRSPFG